jgi:hypothetical protein
MVNGSRIQLILNRETAQNLGRPDRAISPTFFKLNIETRQFTKSMANVAASMTNVLKKTSG